LNPGTRLVIAFPAHRVAVAPDNRKKEWGRAEMGELAYHLVVRAMEGRGGMDARTRFALAIRHAVDGHLPHVRYREAAVARRRDGAGTGSVERSIADWMSIDLNPAVRAIGSLRGRANAIWGYNAYNQHVHLAVRTSVDQSDASAAPAAASVRREHKTTAEVPDLCAVGSIAVLERLLGRVSMNGPRPDPAPPGIVGVGRLLGVEASASFHVAEAIGGGGSIELDAVARLLGASRRSLQRRLAEESTSFEAIRRAARIVAATDALRSDAPLAEVAWRCGFSDLPHMARAIKASCGMSPGLLRAMLRGGVEPEPKAAAVREGFPR
jgi:AraC-like DNA-binding protein